MLTNYYKGLSKLTFIFIIFLAGCSEKINSYQELAELGYSVIPAPREITMNDRETEISSSWGIRADGVESDDIAVKTLMSDLKELYGPDIKVNSSARKQIKLLAEEGSVITNTRDEIDSQAYSIEIKPSEIVIRGNSDQGLFYGVQTLIQLVRSSPDGKLTLPGGTIRDWPSGQLRFLHWDTKHHQDRMETLKRYLDWSARFKVNMIGFELEDKFSYPTHPEIGAPGAFKPEELQEIVDYGLERYIQVVPVIQSPAHMAYVLKHAEFKELRTTCERCPSGGINYQVCLCDERSYELIFDMYRDVINATKGVNYFHVSTDEMYYAGICNKCEPPYKWEDLSADSRDSRSLAWVMFAKKAHDFLKEHDRRMLAWVEYPLLTKYIYELPPDIIDGVYQGKAFVEAQKEIGMQGLIYVSLQGEERLIPRNFASEGDLFSEGRIKSVFETLSYPHMDSIAEGPTIWDSEHPPLGVFGAAWDDSGLHNETFWPGWSAVAQYSWTPGIPSPERHITDFINIYYGPEVKDMTGIYKGLQAQSEFYGRCWDRADAPEIKPNYGNSDQIFEKPRIRRRATLPQPALPNSVNLVTDPVYVEKYGGLVTEATELMMANEDLREKIMTNIDSNSRNKYNLEVLLSIADLTRHNNVMIVSMKEIEDNLLSAGKSHDSGDHNKAVKYLIAAYNIADEVISDRKNTFNNFTATWEKSRFPKGMSIHGREFFHELDDIKDHFADTTPDLSFYIAAERSIKMDEWSDKLEKIIKTYAGRHKVVLNDF